MRRVAHFVQQRDQLHRPSAPTFLSSSSSASRANCTDPITRFHSSDRLPSGKCVLFRRVMRFTNWYVTCLSAARQEQLYFSWRARHESGKTGPNVGRRHIGTHRRVINNLANVSDEFSTRLEALGLIPILTIFTPSQNQTVSGTVPFFVHSGQRRHRVAAVQDRWPEFRYGRYRRFVQGQLGFTRDPRRASHHSSGGDGPVRQHQHVGAGDCSWCTTQSRRPRLHRDCRPLQDRRRADAGTNSKSLTVARTRAPNHAPHSRKHRVRDIRSRCRSYGGHCPVERPSRDPSATRPVGSHVANSS